MIKDMENLCGSIDHQPYFREAQGLRLLEASERLLEALDSLSEASDRLSEPADSQKP